MLIHSEEKIFLEAIDQYFENEKFYNINLENSEIIPEKIAQKEKTETESHTDEEKETDIEMMNIKFYEALNINDNNEIKDISTDFESEDNNVNAEKQKHFIKISDHLFLIKETIEKNKQELYNEYEKQIKIEEKIKELFKGNKIDEYKDKNINNSKNKNCNNKECVE